MMSRLILCNKGIQKFLQGNLWKHWFPFFVYRIKMSFNISQVDHDRIWVWARDHKCTIVSEGSIGGKLTYCFTPTNLGTIFKVECACGSSIDLTDYEDW